MRMEYICNTISRIGPNVNRLISRPLGWEFLRSIQALNCIHSVTTDRPVLNWIPVPGFAVSFLQVEGSSHELSVFRLSNCLIVIWCSVIHCLSSQGHWLNTCVSRILCVCTMEPLYDNYWQVPWMRMPSPITLVHSLYNGPLCYYEARAIQYSYEIRNGCDYGWLLNSDVE